VSYRANLATVAERLTQLQAFLACCCPTGDNQSRGVFVAAR
jgi:hypothetical protein